MATKAQTREKSLKDYSQTLKDLLRYPELLNYEKEQLVKLEKQLITAEKKVVKIKEQIEEQKEILKVFDLKEITTNALADFTVKDLKTMLRVFRESIEVDGISFSYLTTRQLDYYSQEEEDLRKRGFVITFDGSLASDKYFDYESEIKSRIEIDGVKITSDILKQENLEETLMKLLTYTKEHSND